MKKVFFALLSAFMLFTTASAQTMKVYRDGQLKAIYYVSKDDRVEFSQDFPLPGDQTPTANYEAVDLGLSVKWANMNVGANKPEDVGGFFAWGEVVAKPLNYSYATINSGWEGYKWCNGMSEMTKYCDSPSFGRVDNKTTLEPEDDAAHVNCGDSWRMPTKDELRELSDTTKVRWTYTQRNGRNGYLVTSKINGNSIFLPSYDIVNPDGVENHTACLIWSSTLVESNNDSFGANCARILVCLADEASGSTTVVLFPFPRNVTSVIRPVCPY